MKKIIIALCLGILLFGGCSYYKELQEGRKFCKENPVTCQDKVDEKAAVLAEKAGTVVGDTVAGTLTNTPVAALAKPAGAVSKELTKVSVTPILAFFLGMFIGRKNKKAGIQDPK